MTSRILTIGQVAQHFGVDAWQVRALFTRGYLPEGQRVGAYRVFTETDLPSVEVALNSAGYLEREAVVHD